MDVCPRCGKPLHEEARYCWYCGLFLLDPILPELLQLNAQVPATQTPVVPAEAEQNLEEFYALSTPETEVAAEQEQTLPEENVSVPQTVPETLPETYDVFDIPSEPAAEIPQEAETIPEAEAAAATDAAQQETVFFDWNLQEAQTEDSAVTEAASAPAAEEAPQEVSVPEEQTAEEIPQEAEPVVSAAQEDSFDWSFLDFQSETPDTPAPEAIVPAPETVAPEETISEVPAQQENVSFDWSMLTPQDPEPAAQEAPAEDTQNQPESAEASTAEPKQEPAESVWDVSNYLPRQPESEPEIGGQAQDYNAVTENMPRPHSAISGLPLTDTVSATEPLPRNQAYDYRNNVTRPPHTENPVNGTARRPVEDIPYTEPLPRKNALKTPDAEKVPQNAVNGYAGQQNAPAQGGGYRPQGGQPQRANYPQGNAPQNGANGYRQNPTPQNRPAPAPTAEDVLNFYRNVLRFNDQQITKNAPGAQALVKNLMSGETLEFVAPGSLMNNRAPKAVTLAATNQRILIVDAARKLPGILSGKNNSSVLSLPYPTIVNLDASQALQQGILILRQADHSQHPLAFERPWLEFIYKSLYSVILRHKQNG